MQKFIKDKLLNDKELKESYVTILKDYPNEKAQINEYFGKTLKQRIYNALHDIRKQPKCEHNHFLPFKSFEEGYAVECKTCEHFNQFKKQQFQINDLYVRNDRPTFLEQTENFETKEVSSSIITTLDSNADEEQILKEHGLNPKIWKIKKVTHSMWNQSSTNTLYASKIWAALRTIEDLNIKTIQDKIKEAVNLPRSDRHLELFEKRQVKKTLLIPVADLHFGLINEAKSYNMEKAEYRLLTSILELDSRIKDKSEISRIIITLGNDFFNADTLSGTTTKGTPQHQEDLYFSVFNKGLKLAIDFIELIHKKFPESKIEVYNVLANHDKTTSCLLNACLAQRYNSNPAFKDSIFVDVEHASSPRLYLQAGTNLLGFGHETKLKDCYHLMSTEMSQVWSECKYKHFFIAHLHHEEVKEINSLVVRRLPTLSGASQWSQEMGFLHSTPRAQYFVFDNETGLETIHNINV